MLTVNQEQPQKALEILPSIDEHFSTYNVRLLTLIKCGGYLEAVEAIENQYKNKRISKDVVSDRLNFIALNPNTRIHKKKYIKFLIFRNFSIGK